MESVACFIGVAGAFRLLQKGWFRVMQRRSNSKEFTIANQPARFARDKAAGNVRVMDLEQLYDPAFIKGKTVLVTGCNRGIGLAVSQELAACGAVVIGTHRGSHKVAGLAHVIGGIEMTDNEVGTKLAAALRVLKVEHVDVLVNNAGYFYEPAENMQHLNFPEEIKMIDICALGPLRATSGLFNAGLLKSGAKVAIISSQGGSVEWRTTQNPRGGDYGHHMSKAAANMCGRLLSQELKHSGVCVTLLHPGFNRCVCVCVYV